ncbi:hypothetical protein NUH86_09070 [Sphingobium sp. JS3065]|jgi:hypothetical protein|uniref:hypothetical protein n=1 Tax=Sphingobium sp. JS3065 TaxID=2970925 RepID=UPI002264C3C1|nr:hypothetical protein [Sphingobium sp. JS3065]UZW53710.1 hypothetical protein NUH86_09070 [Sphingobium sp. JS3065]
MRKFALIALAGALALAACGKKEEEAPVTNNLVEPPVENVIVDEPEATPEPSNNAAPAPAPAPTISEQQQIEDDAAATGMTARLERAGAEEGANATQ